MKNNCIKLILLGCVLFAGCGQFSKVFSNRNPDGSAGAWGNSGHARSVGVGTGIDPQAREIEKRLGYESEWF